MISTAQATCSALPARRADLVVRSLGENERFVVKDPRNGAYYQLGEQEHFLLMQLDGTRTADAVCVNFAERFSLVASVAALVRATFRACAETGGVLMGAYAAALVIVKQATGTPGYLFRRTMRLLRAGAAH